MGLGGCRHGVSARTAAFRSLAHLCVCRITVCEHMNLHGTSARVKAEPHRGLNAMVYAIGSKSQVKCATVVCLLHQIIVLHRKDELVAVGACVCSGKTAQRRAPIRCRSSVIADGTRGRACCVIPDRTGISAACDLGRPTIKCARIGGIEPLDVLASKCLVTVGPSVGHLDFQTSQQELPRAWP